MRVNDDRYLINQYENRTVRMTGLQSRNKIERSKDKTEKVSGWYSPTTVPGKLGW